MGKASRTKRERRANADFVASLTACEGTWLEKPPTSEEQTRIDAARKQMMQHRAAAQMITANTENATRFALEVFRDERFAPLYFDDWVLESIFKEFDEPPVVEDPNDPTFSNWLRTAAESIGSSRVRRAMSEQVRRFLPQYVEAGQITPALIIEHNAYLTVMSEAATPLLVQMLVGALTRWYDEHEEDEEVAEETAPEVA